MRDRHLDEELDILKNDLMEMASLTEKAIKKCISAYEALDGELAQTVIAEDKAINSLELKIEEHAIDLLACFQPIACDLRFITTAMKLNAELERIGDLAVNMAERVVDLASKDALCQLIEMKELGETAATMVRKAIESFLEGDIALAKEVMDMDAKADDLRNKIVDTLINVYLVPNGSSADRAVAMILAARHLERISDHATYIAEDVIYMVEAKNVKHSCHNNG